MDFYPKHSNFTLSTPYFTLGHHTLSDLHRFRKTLPGFHIKLQRNHYVFF